MEIPATSLKKYHWKNLKEKKLELDTACDFGSFGGSRRSVLYLHAGADALLCHSTALPDPPACSHRVMGVGSLTFCVVTSCALCSWMS